MVLKEIVLHKMNKIDLVFDHFDWDVVCVIYGKAVGLQFIGKPPERLECVM